MIIYITPLHLAAENGNEEIFELLLATNKFDINSQIILNQIFNEICNQIL